MRIMFVCDTMGSGGAERVISVLSNSFATKGHNISILMLGHDAKEPFYALNNSIELIYLGTEKLSFFKKVKKLKSIILSKEPTIVISFLSYVCIYVWQALKNTKIPYIVSERNDPNQRERIKQFLLNKAFKRACGCVFQTEDAMHWYKCVNTSKAIVIHNPVSLDYQPKNLLESKKQVLYVGRFNDQKNCSTIIEAFNVFIKNHPGYSLKMFGSGPLKDELEKQIISNQLIDKVNILPNSKTWQKDECDSAMFVLASKYEGMPNVLAEALCLGIPCVSTNCTIGGPKELKSIFPDRLILASSSSVNDLAFAMDQCVNLSRGEAKIPDELSEGNIVNQWLGFIRKTL